MSNAFLLFKKPGYLIAIPFAFGAQLRIPYPSGWQLHGEQTWGQQTMRRCEDHLWSAAGANVSTGTELRPEVQQWVSTRAAEQFEYLYTMGKIDVSDLKPNNDLGMPRYKLLSEEQ